MPAGVLERRETRVTPELLRVLLAAFDIEARVLAEEAHVPASHLSRVLGGHAPASDAYLQRLFSALLQVASRTNGIPATMNF